MTLHYVRCALGVTLVAATSLAAKSPITPLTAVILPDGRYSPVALREMGREAANILKKSGVALQWRLQVPSQASEGLLVVVMVHGRCEIDGAAPDFRPGPLGWSHEVNGTVLPFSELACDSIRSAVQFAPGAANQIRGNILLGRAMGRVLAHELYHIVADTSKHGRGGVAQAAFSPRELTAGQFELQQSDIEAMRSGFTRAR